MVGWLDWMILEAFSTLNDSVTQAYVTVVVVVIAC